MRKIFWTLLYAIIAIQLSGCSGWQVRTSTSKRTRTDQEISGNRGFIFGKPTSAPKKPAFTERKVYQVEVEIPQWKRKKKSVPAPVKKKPTVRAPKEDKVLWGNRGYLYGGPKASAEQPSPTTKKPLFEKSPVAAVKEKISEILSKPEKPPRMRTYKVRKGDTLQEISRRFYGTTKKWSQLYKANRDKLKSPDAVYPGQVLVIPELGEFKK